MKLRVFLQSGMIRTEPDLGRITLSVVGNTGRRQAHASVSLVLPIQPTGVPSGHQMIVFHPTPRAFFKVVFRKQFSLKRRNVYLHSFGQKKTIVGSFHIEACFN